MNTEFYQRLRPILEQFQAELITVTKYQSLADIRTVYDAGLRKFGENRVQELCEKQAVLPQDIEWHLIGHLQRNKVKLIAPFIACIHSVDSIKLLTEINTQAAANHRVIPCLLQCYIASEETKFGLNYEELIALLNDPMMRSFEHISIVGIMGMATNTTNTEQIKKEFSELQRIFNELKSRYFKDQAQFKELSMGMSSDYLIALNCGSTMIRIGSSLFSN